MEDVTTCCACHGTSFSEVLRGRDRVLGLPGEFSLVKCSTCGLKWVSPRPDEKEIAFYYPAEYGAYQFDHASTSVNEAKNTRSWVRRSLKTYLGWFLMPALEWYLSLKTYQLPSLPPGKVLEYGFGDGKILKSLSDSGWQVYGVELNEESIKHARDDLGIAAMSLDQWDRMESGDFDLICGFHVLEHVHDPLTLLKRFRELIKHEGVLVIEVPNSRSLDYRLFRSRAVLHLPNHLYHFNDRNLRMLLDSAGFEVIRVSYPRITNTFVTPIGFWLEDIFGPNRLSTLLKDYHNRTSRWGRIVEFVSRPLAIALSYMRLGGYISVWAQPVRGQGSSGDSV